MMLIFLLSVWIDAYFYPDIYIHTPYNVEYVLVDDSLYLAKEVKTSVSIAFFLKYKDWNNIFPSTYSLYNDLQMAYFSSEGLKWSNTAFLEYKDRSLMGNILSFLEYRGYKRILFTKYNSKELYNAMDLYGVKIISTDSVIDSFRDYNTYFITMPSPLKTGDSIHIEVIYKNGQTAEKNLYIPYVPDVWSLRDKGKYTVGENIIVSSEGMYLINGKKLYNKFNDNYVKIKGNTIYYPFYALKFIGYGKWEKIDYGNKGRFKDISDKYILFERNRKYFLYGDNDSLSFYLPSKNPMIFGNGAVSLNNGRINYYGRDNYQWIFHWKNVDKIYSFDTLIAIYKSGIIYIIKNTGELIYEQKFDLGEGDMLLNNRFFIYYNKRGIHGVDLYEKKEVFWHRIDRREKINNVFVSLWRNKIVFTIGNILFYRLLPE